MDVGLNAEGQLGLGNTIYYSSPKQVGSLTNWSKIQVGDNCGIALKTDGTLWSWGGNSFGQLGLGDTVNRSSPTQIGSGTNWAQICVGNSSPVCFALKTDGTLWAWGYNQTYGALGLNDTVNRSSPTQVGALTNWSKFPTSAYKPGLLMIKSDGTLWGWGLNTDGQVGIGNTINRSSPAQIGSLTSWQKCALSYRNSFALRS